MSSGSHQVKDDSLFDSGIPPIDLQGKGAGTKRLRALYDSSPEELLQNVKKAKVNVDVGIAGGTGTKLDVSSDAVFRGGGSLFKNIDTIQVNGGNFTEVGRDNITNHYYSATDSSDVAAKIQNWLASNLHYRSIQIDTLNKRTVGTGRWFVECQQFQGWLKKEVNTLWATGIPGAGKTILASTVIDLLQKLVKGSEQGKLAVGFIYCRYTERVPVDMILSALIKQLLEDCPSLIESLEPIFLQHQRYKTRPTQAELVDILMKISIQFDTIFFVLDGVGETPSEDQIDLLRLLSSLKVQLIITSRRLANMEPELPHAVHVDIVAQRDDIRLYVSHCIDRQPPLRRLLEGKDLKEKIISDICEKAQGMFLHATLQVEMLRGCLTTKDVEDAVEAFPATTKDIYVAALDRIRQQPAKYAVRALRVLMWLVFTHRSLTIEELQYAVAVSLETNIFDAKNVVDEVDLVSICCGLVTVDAETRLVRLVHFTAKDALQSALLHDFPDPHGIIAPTCVSNLISCQFHESQIQWQFELEVAMEHDPFLRYAYDAWYIHARHCTSGSAIETISAFLRSCRSFPIQPTLPSLPWRNPRGDQANGLQLAAYYGLAGFVDIDPDCNGPTPNLKLTPLMHALLGHINSALDATTRSAFLLLQAPEIQVNATSINGHTALMLAALDGNTAVVERLLEFGDIDADMVEVKGRSALMWACERGHHGVVGLVVDRFGVDVNKADGRGQTGLVLASRYGRKGVVKVLLGHQGVEINKADRDGGTALMWAAREGYGSVLELLLGHPGLGVNQADGRRQTALVLAIRYGHEGVVKSLLRHPELELNRADGEGPTALTWAATNVHHDVVTLLLEHPGVEVNLGDLGGRTALILASQKNDDGVVKLLLQHPGVEVNRTDWCGQTALIWASKLRCEGVVKVLLGHPGIRVDVVDDTGSTVLMWGSKCSCEGMVELLLMYSGVEVNRVNREGQSAVMLASRYGHEGVVKVLIAHPGVEVNCPGDRDGRTALMWAAREGYEGVVELLLAHPGVEVNRVDGDGRTALILASRRGRDSVVKALLRHVAIQVNRVDVDGRSALIWAARDGYDGVVGHLLAHPGRLKSIKQTEMEGLR